MNLTITMTAYRRPDYTREVLGALARCRGIGDCTLLVQCEPGFPETVAAFDGWSACELSVEINAKRLGLNRNSQQVIGRAIRRRADANLHIEDDTVLSPDALEYYRWALDQYGNHPRVFSIAGYNKPSREPTEALRYECRLRPWFTCWGWAVTRRRLVEIHADWCTHNPKSFAWPINRRTRRGRYEIHPQLSRVQNIGYELGENGRPAEWYRNNHRAPWVAGDIPPGHWRLMVPRDHPAKRDFPSE